MAGITVSGLLQCTVLSDASRNKTSLKSLMVGDLYQLCEHAPWYFFMKQTVALKGIHPDTNSRL